MYLTTPLGQLTKIAENSFYSDMVEKEKNVPFSW